MSFPRYPTYKPSGVEWLGQVPEHWEMGQSRRRFRLRNEPTKEEDEQLTASQKHGIIRQAEFIESEGRRVVEVIKGQDILKHVEPGDFVISMRSFQGGLEYSEVRGCISSAYVMLAPVKQVIPTFFSWLFKSQPYIQALQSTTNLVRDGQALRFSNFCQVDIPIIPPNEQLAIATFLDHENAKIDALIAEQQRLIELLQEKRQAVISHAVTKGLNPHAPMKDSGVEWLGEVPEHWDIRPIKHLARVGNGSTPNRDNSDYWSDHDGFPWLNSSVVNQAEVSEADRFVTKLALRDCHLPIIVPPAVLVGITGQGRTRGMAAKLIFKATVSQHIAYIKPNLDQLAVDFLLRALEAAYERLRFDSEGSGSTKGAITCEQLGLMRMPVPSPLEQVEIVAILQLEVASNEALKAQSELAIRLLQERRSALISAAVTGQIDVRGLVPEAEAA
jgi:type I restriction enzyme S subunit